MVGHLNKLMQAFATTSASADCVACDSESYQDEADHQNTECKQQPKCTRGYVLGSPSTDSLDTRHAILECTACPENAYMSQDNHTNRACTVQPSCSKGQYITPDSSIAERECKQCAVASFQSKEAHRESNCNPQPFCKEGERLADGESLSVKGSCVACGAGEYRKETRHQLATCEKCGPLECPTGQHLTGECERTQENSLQCTNCAQHTYGDTVQVAVVGATRTIPDKAMYPCKPCDIACPAGTYPKYDETGACAQPRRATANDAMCADCSIGTWGLGTKGKTVKQLDNPSDWNREQAWCQTCGEFETGNVDSTKYKNVYTEDKNRLTNQDDPSCTEYGGIMAANPGFYQNSPGQGECLPCQDFCPRGETTVSKCTPTTPRVCNDTASPQLCTAAAAWTNPWSGPLDSWKGSIVSGKCSSRDTEDVLVFEAELDPFEIARANIYTGAGVVDMPGTDPTTCFDAKGDRDDDLTTQVLFARTSSSTPPKSSSCERRDAGSKTAVCSSCNRKGECEGCIPGFTFNPGTRTCSHSVISAGAWHFAPVGSFECDYGSSAPKDQCSAAVRELAEANGETSPTAMEESRTADDHCGSWGQVPFGCSAQHDSWRPHYKTNGASKTECDMTSYSLVCSGPALLSPTFPYNAQMHVLGVHSVHYHCKDFSGNEATPAVRSIRVQDTLSPTLVLCANGVDTAVCGNAMPADLKCPLQYGSKAATIWPSWVGGITQQGGAGGDASTQFSFDVSLNVTVGSRMKTEVRASFEVQRDRTDLAWIASCDIRDREAGIDQGPGSIAVSEIDVSFLSFRFFYFSFSFSQRNISTLRFLFPPCHDNTGVGCTPSASSRDCTCWVLCLRRSYLILMALFAGRCCHSPSNEQDCRLVGRRVVLH